MMDFNLNDIDKFCVEVISVINSIDPSISAVYMGRGEILVNNSNRVDINNIFKIAHENPTQSNQIIYSMLTRIVNGFRELGNDSELSFAEVSPHIMPRIHPETIFENKPNSDFAFVPFVNDTIISFVYDLPEITVNITKSHLRKWGIEVEVAEQIARTNLEHYNDNLYIEIAEPEMSGKFLILSLKDGYDSSRLLMSSLYNKIRPYLGNTFYVGIPARDVFIAVSSQPLELVKKVHEKVETNFQKLPYPITSSLFTVTMDGIASCPMEFLR